MDAAALAAAAVADNFSVKAALEVPVDQAAQVVLGVAPEEEALEECSEAAEDWAVKP